jgi:hypothetical protein
MKIIFLTSIPFMKHNYKDLYVESVKNKFPIEMWDLSKIYKLNYNQEDLVDNVLKIENLQDLDNNLKRVTLDDDIVIITNILKDILEKVDYIFKKYNVITVSITKESQSEWIRHRVYLDFPQGMQWKKRLKAIPANSKVLKKIYHILKYKNVKFDYMLASGNYQPELCKNFYQIHHVKYDEYLQALDSVSIIEGDYILFLDGAFADHPSYIDKKNSLIHDDYVNDLNFFFDKIEEHCHMPVVISAHPKSKYKQNDFGERAIIKYKTPELIQHAKIIITHQTTSLINAILLYKPIYIIYNEKIMHSCVGDYMRWGFEYAKLLGIDIINMGKQEFEINDTIDKKKYDWFIKNHIVNVQKLELSNAELICDFLNNLN